MYNISRQEIENLGRRSAGIKDETESTITVTALNSFDLRLLKDDISVTPCLKQDGFWEAWITSWFTKWIRPGMTVLDIGANSGYYTMLFERLVGRSGSVIAYEPNPVYAELLRSTRDLNQADFNIREVALSDRPGIVTLRVPGDYHGSASIVGKFENFKNKEYEVRTTTLDLELQSVSLFRHDVVKIDAEGAEQLIWNGGRKLFDDPHNYTTIVIEFTPNCYDDRFLDELFDWGQVNFINYDGNEDVATKGMINRLTDWAMIVVRKK